MTAVFIQLINMSIAAGWLILAVILLRIILKNAPKWIRCILWGLVALRLIFPVSVESIFSLLPTAETIPQDIVYAENPVIHTGVTAINSVVNPYLSEGMAPEVGVSVNPMQIVMNLGAVMWVVGMIGMMIYAGISYLKIRNRVSASLSAGENIFFCDYIDTPFVLGIVRPRIYLPSALAEEENVSLVVAHERAHIRRHDHWWKPLGFLLLTIYWFNPVIWIAYILLCRDIELACDEYVVSHLEEEEKCAYSDALLACSIGRNRGDLHHNIISACPIAFGEVGVKDRVKAVLHYKRPAFLLVLLGVLGCIIAGVCFLTNPKDNTSNARSDILSCNAVSEDCNAYVQPAYYPEGFDWDYEQLPEGYINEKGTLVFSADWETDSLVVSEDYYNNYNPENRSGSTFIEKETYTLKRNKDGQFELHVALRSANGDMAVYFVQAPDGVYVIKIIFADDEASLMISSQQYQPEAFLGMSYEDFQKQTETEAEFYHANFYAAAIPNTEITAIFLAEGWDDSKAITVLQKEDKVIRLEGKMSALIDGFSKEMSISEFMEDSEWRDRLLGYTIEKGAGTAYYVADQYAAVSCDMNGDSVADQMLQVALSQDDTISPDSLFWLAPVPYENEIIVYNGKEYKKSELCNATLRWLKLSEQERMFSSYMPPEFMIFEENWGVTLTIDNITPTSASIVCTQAGGEPTGELQTGSWYIIENWTQENGWKEVEHVLQGELAWTMEAWAIRKDSKSEWSVNWKWLYGELPPGKYRIGKEIVDFRKSGDYDSFAYWTEFEIK